MKYLCLILLFVMVNSNVGKKQDFRIIGGEEDTDKIYPWVVKLVRLEEAEYIFSCSGSIISPEAILTAAHCSGTHVESEAVNGTIQLTRILQIINHVSTNDSIGTPLNDIAIYKIEHTKVKKYGKIHAADYQSLVGFEVIVTGFGLTKLTNIYEDVYPYLRRNSGTEKRKYGIGMIKSCDIDSFEYSYLFMCVVRECQNLALISGGDSGGPVIFDGKIVGVNNAGTDTSGKMFLPHIETLSVYAAPVSPYLDWISKTAA